MHLCGLLFVLPFKIGMGELKENFLIIITIIITIVILQLLEAAWCLTNIAAGKPEETKALVPALPLLIAHLGGL